VASESFAFRKRGSSSERSKLAEDSEECERFGLIGVVGERLGIMSRVGISNWRIFDPSGFKGGL